MADERTLVLCKPDAVARGLVGEVIGRLERKGFRLLAMELRTLDEATAKQHYGEHEGKPFFGDLVSFITSGPLVALCVEGPDAVGAVRTLMGPTNPITAPPGSIRGDFGLEIEKNLVHGSDSPESAARELALFFPGM
ncbi:MAG TPA: nucleoside-diphosphate kinase [Actinomycetes bacterium]|nr:nucleoside-diphosphate kinase [Actinomycetes bacterium]HEX5878596.1 nucleoside-diphosphate kinase [Actinomycetota bacterium]